MQRRPRVALLIETSNSYARGLLRGVIRYVREQHRPWSLELPEQGRGASPPTWLSRWPGDGVIARIENSRIARALLRSRLPVIDVSAARLVPDIPWVETDDREIARLAVEHLLERGFREFGYVGEFAFNWARWRHEAFARELAAHGFPCAVHDWRSRSTGEVATERERSRLIRWIAELPRPAGIMVCYDRMGQRFLDTCREMDVAVPEDIAVLGVDNDDLICSLSSPGLSSVIPDVERTGYLAAQLLDEAMAGRPPRAEGHFVPPLGIATRPSTDILAMDDRHIAAALRFIREHACEGIQVADVLRRVPLTRRVLEQRFRTAVGRTPHAEIIRLRVRRVGELLVSTDLSLQEIARRTGFEHVEYLSVAFKRELGLSPSVYRAQRR